jgi:hypothetical protein
MIRLCRMQEANFGLLGEGSAQDTMFTCQDVSSRCSDR